MSDTNPYEADEFVSQYLDFHYGETYFGVDNFARACGEICNAIAKEQNFTGKALDIGCAVGRTSFELSKYFQHVDAIDFSHQFVATAAELQQTGTKNYTVKTEGQLTDSKTVQLSNLGYGDTVKHCSFKQGDACNLDSSYQGYDLIFAGNLIDRLYSPQQFLSNIYSRLNIGGVLILTSPYTWLEEYTNKENWLGGYEDNKGNSIRSLDGLTEQLTPNFDMLKAPQDVPFVIRETARKYQHTLAQMTIWKRTR